MLCLVEGVCLCTFFYVTCSGCVCVGVRCKAVCHVCVIMRRFSLSSLCICVIHLSVSFLECFIMVGMCIFCIHLSLFLSLVF